MHCRCLTSSLTRLLDRAAGPADHAQTSGVHSEKGERAVRPLMNIANRKQEEMKDMIVETLNTMKEELLDDAANMEFKGGS